MGKTASRIPGRESLFRDARPAPCPQDQSRGSDRAWDAIWGGPQGLRHLHHRRAPANRRAPCVQGVGWAPPGTFIQGTTVAGSRLRGSSATRGTESDMARLRRVAAVAIALCPRAVLGALVDAGRYTEVYTYAPLFDTRLGDDDGCDPAGCIGDLTRVSERILSSSPLLMRGASW